MQRQRFGFFVLLLSFLFGAAMIGTGLASLPSATQKIETVILNPALTNVEEKIQPSAIVDEDSMDGDEEDEDEEEIIPPGRPEQNEFKVRLKHGETIANVLHQHGVSDDEAARAMGVFARNYNLKNLRAGNVFEVELTSATEGRHVKSVKLKSDITKNIGLYADNKGSFVFQNEEIKFSNALKITKAPIVGSFYQSATRAGVTPAITSQLIAALSYDVDFQRDLQAGNKLTVLSNVLQSADGRYIKSKRPIYVKVEMRKKNG